MILIDFVFKTGKNYYPQVLLEECKYVVKEKQIPDFDRENSDEENSNEEKSDENSDEENSNEENSNEENLKNINITHIKKLIEIFL